MQVCVLLIVIAVSITHLLYQSHAIKPTSNKRKWAVLVAGSNGWSNYRHQADVCHAYQILRKHGIPKRNIITFMFDDIAYNNNNPYLGQIFNNPRFKNVYKNVVIDYKGHEVTKENIFNVLLGNEVEMKGIGSGKVLKSGPEDHVFVYYTDHGNVGIVVLPGNHYITYSELTKTLELMQENNKFKHLLFYMEACHSGSMFSELPSNIKIFSATAANEYQSSYSCYCGIKNLPCLADQFSAAWMENTERVDVNSLTIGEQIRTVKNLTKDSSVCKYGDLTIERFMIGDFFGSRHLMLKHLPTKQNDHGVIYPSHEHDFHYLYKKLNESVPGSFEELHIAKEINSTLVDMKYVQERMKTIAKLLTPTSDHFDEIIAGRHEVKREHGQCFTAVLKALMNNCYTNSEEKQHLLTHTQTVVNLCAQEYLSEDKIVRTVYYACKLWRQEKADLEESEACWMGPNVCNIFCHAKGKLVGEEMSGSCLNSDNICVCKKKKTD